MTIRVAIDGVVTDAAEARVPVLDRGFLYGDAVFEVLRTYGGVAHELDRHLERLARSAKTLRFELPCSLAELRREVEATIASATLPEAYVRVIVTRGRGPLGLDPSNVTHPLRVVVVAPLVVPPPSMYEQGVAVITIPSSHEAGRRRSGGAKVANYVENILATVEAKERGAHEAILVDAAGRVLEGATSNVFVVRAGRVTTPRLEEGVLGGITREVVLSLARELGIPAGEGTLTREDVTHADEVFLTSSIREVAPVVRVDDVEVGDGRPGTVTSGLHAAYRADLERRYGPSRARG